MCGYFCIGFVDFMLAGMTLTDFTKIISPNNFKKIKLYKFKLFDQCLKMAKCDSHEARNMYPNLSATERNSTERSTTA